ncbi:MAG: hypothetical protein ABFS39_03755 [Pseudomonadota bacterium]
MSRQVISIDKLNIRLPNGWRGDPTLLARQVAEQIQRQAADLHSAKQLDLSLQGHFAGDARQVAEQVGGKLSAQHRKAGIRRQGR